MRACQRRGDNFNWWQFLFKRYLADLTFELLYFIEWGEFSSCISIVCVFDVFLECVPISIKDVSLKGIYKIESLCVCGYLVWKLQRQQMRIHERTSVRPISAEFISKIKLLNGGKVIDRINSQWKIKCQFDDIMQNISAYRLYSWPIESISRVCMLDIDSDVSYPPDSVPLNRRSLCMYRYDSDGCFVWRNPNNRRNCKCHSVCLSCDLRTLCTEYPKVGRL